MEITRKNTKHISHVSKERFSELVENATVDFKNVMSIFITLGWITTLDAMDRLKSAGLYQGPTKKAFNHAVEVYHSFEYALKNSNVDGHQLFQPSQFGIERGVTRDKLFDFYHDIGSNAYSNLYPHVENVRHAVLQEMTKYDIKHREVLQYVSLAESLMHLASEQYNGLVAELLDNDGINYDFLFHHFNPEQVYKATAIGWQTLVDRFIPKDIQRQVEGIESPTIDNAVECLINAVRLDVLNSKSMDEAYEQHKDLFPKGSFRKYRLAYNKEILKRTGKLNTYRD